MTHSEQEEALRRALHAVADTIEPAADGLERIRERLSKPRSLAVAWLMAVWTDLAQPLLLRMEPVLAGAAGRLSDRLGEWLRLMIRALGTAAERLRPAGARLRLGAERLRPAGARLRLGAERLRPVGDMLVNAIRMLRPGSGMSRHEKLRSALAFAAAAVIGVAGGFALSDGLPQSMITTLGFGGNPPQHASANSHNNPKENGSGQHMPPGSSNTPSGTHGPSPHPTPQCSATPKPGADPNPTSPSPTSPSPTSPSPTSPSPSVAAGTPAGPGSTPAGPNPRATVGATPSATHDLSRVVDPSSGGRPAVTTAPPTKPAPSTGTHGCV